MQDVDNDMDGLFKRAAENYPLNIGKSGWESVSKKLTGTGVLNVGPSKNKKNRKLVVLLFLLFLLPGGWLIFQYDSHSTEGKRNLNNSLEKVYPEPASKNNITLQQGKTGQPGNMFLKIEPSSKELQVFSKKICRTNILNSIAAYNSNDKTLNRLQKDQPHVMKDVNEADGSDNKVLMKQVEKNYISSGPVSRIIKTIPPLVVPNIDVDKKLAIKAGSSEANESYPSSSVHKKGLYIGFVAGADFSKVSTMPYSKMGAITGTFLGITLTHKMFLEIGINWNKKHYKSYGSDFNMDKIRSTMATGMVINDVESHSNLIEVPVQVRYNLINKNRSTFSIAGGFSAYIMTNENNRYNVTMNGSRQRIEGVYTANNYKVPAIARMGFAYQYNITGNTKISIEPVFKIPLMGIGVGSLPITSASVQLGISRHL